MLGLLVFLRTSPVYTQFDLAQSILDKVGKSEGKSSSLCALLCSDFYPEVTVVSIWDLENVYSS